MSLLLAFQGPPPIQPDILVSLEAEELEELETIEGFTGFFVEDDILFSLESEQVEEDFVYDDNPVVVEIEELILFALEAFEELEEFIIEEPGFALPDEPPVPDPIEFLWSLSDEFEFEPETGEGIDIPNTLIDDPIATLVREWIIRARRRGRR